MGASRGISDCSPVALVHKFIKLESLEMVCVGEMLENVGLVFVGGLVRHCVMFCGECWDRSDEVGRGACRGSSD